MTSFVLEDPITGYIPLKEGNIVFSARNYEFTFMNPLNKPIKIEVDSNGYVWGTMHKGGNTIAIYIKDSFSIISKQIVKTWCFIIFEAHYIDRKVMQAFDGIRFWNGGIKAIYAPNALHENLELSKDNHFVYDYKKDCYRVGQKLSEGFDVEYCFSSMINQHYSFDETSLKNTDALLDCTFSKSQTLKDIRMYYDAVFGMCAFLTFRKQIHFEKISLFLVLEDGKRREHAQCFIKQPDGHAERKPEEVISARWISEAGFRLLMSNLFNIDKQPGLPLFILPFSKKDLLTIDSGKIRLICSAIEMELNNSKETNPETDQKMAELIDQVKNIVKGHRDSSPNMENKYYDPIFTSISHWGLPLSTRLWNSWKNHTEAHSLADKLRFEITEKKIGDFCKARNAITHMGANDNIDNDVAMTAFMLIGLTYCYALSRIGFNKNEIESIMQTKLIY